MQDHDKFFKRNNNSKFNNNYDTGVQASVDAYDAEIQATELIETEKHDQIESLFQDAVPEVSQPKSFFRRMTDAPDKSFFEEMTEFRIKNGFMPRTKDEQAIDPTILNLLYDGSKAITQGTEKAVETIVKGFTNDIVYVGKSVGNYMFQIAKKVYKLYKLKKGINRISIENESGDQEEYWFECDVGPDGLPDPTTVRRINKPEGL